MKPSIFGGVVAAAVSCCMGALFFGGENIRAEDAPPPVSELSIVAHESGVGVEVWIITDKVSGCQYIFARLSGAAITPRLDDTGRPMCGEVQP